MKDNPYLAPKSNLENSNSRLRINSSSPTFIRKFAYSFLSCFTPMAILIVIGVSRHNRFELLLGLAAVSVFAGVVGGLLQTDRKIIYIPVSSALVILGLIALGSAP